MSVAIVIPVYNEAKVISEVVQSVKAAGHPTVVVVDDGSSDQSYTEAQQAGAICIRHKINRGKGAATKTGMAAALKLGASIIVTMDGDGQHDPRDIAQLIIPLQTQQCDVVLGTRLHAPHRMPASRVWANHIANALTWLVHGLWVTDSQSGFRAYTRPALTLIQPHGDRYEYDSAIIREIKRHQLQWQEVPITVHYTPYSTTKRHRQNWRNALKTLRNMVWQVLS